MAEGSASEGGRAGAVVEVSLTALGNMPSRSFFARISAIAVLFVSLRMTGTAGIGSQKPEVAFSGL